MSVRRQPDDIVWKRPGAGMVGEGSWVVIVDNGYLDWCPLDCGDPDCREWVTVWALTGSTREEAVRSHAMSTYRGVAAHVNECEMLDEPEVA